MSDTKPFLGPTFPSTVIEPDSKSQPSQPTHLPLLTSVVNQDIYLLGGQYAILAQFAHPSLAKGSFLHSSFATRIPQRLRNTARFLNVAVCGTPDEKKAIFGVIHKYHARVKGDDYTADDPELHKWTAATLLVSIVKVKETFFGPMSQDEMQALLEECEVFGTSLRMESRMWPKTIEEFWRYWDYNIATLEVTDMARSLAQDLLYPKNLPMHMAASLPVARLVTMNWLPDRLAREYHLAPGLGSQAAYVAFVSWVKAVYPFLPEGVRSRRHREYMRDLKAAVEKIKETGHWGTK
ncbi:hypothetical protein BJY04DRAFT_211675 [Aspergillus karnatakaensis]|uniref:oxygenase MpaB family protein n=1 Tax=Aspergillus karnatakaensis TaxID=1810916 RepID=UPI003CCCFF7F